MNEDVIEISRCETCPLFRLYEYPLMECMYYKGKSGCSFSMDHSPSKKPGFCKVIRLKAVLAEPRG